MISKKHKCVFLHVPKTAGQSVERVFLDLNDLTWENRAPLLLKKNNGIEGAPERLSHLTASQYVDLGFIQQGEFDSFYKFAFVRNPWDRAYSMYKYLDYSYFMDFDQFIERLPSWKRKNPMFFGNQVNYVLINGKMIVNRVGKFETLQDDFNLVCQDLDLPLIKLPHVNKVQEPKKKKLIKEVLKQPMLLFYALSKTNGPMAKKYQQAYSERSKRFVEEFYKDDIETFNYTF